MKKLNNKGWTLVEVTVTLVVALIVMAFAGGILLSSFNVFLSNSSLNEAKMVGDNIYNWVSEQIVYATDLQIIEEDDSHETPQYSNIIRFQDGELRYKTATKAEYNLFGEGYYAHSDIKMTVKAYNKHMISIKIEVLKNREVLYQTGSSMKVLNIQLKDGAIKGMVGTELVNPKLVFSSTKDAA